MTALINIVHPYTWKLIRNTLQIGPVKEFQNRDEILACFIQKAFDANARILHQRHEHPKALKGMLCDTAFQADPQFTFLADPRIETATTTSYGVPIPDQPNGKITEEQWLQLREAYITSHGLELKIRSPKRVVFIGGIFENCLVNAMIYHQERYQKKDQQLFYVPEFCVSQNQTLRKKTEKLLSKKNILPINYRSVFS